MSRYVGAFLVWVDVSARAERAQDFQNLFAFSTDYTQSVVVGIIPFFVPIPIFSSIAWRFYSSSLRFSSNVSYGIPNTNV